MVSIGGRVDFIETLRLMTERWLDIHARFPTEQKTPGRKNPPRPAHPIRDVFAELADTEGLGR
jgi:hypothetical protein